MSFKNAPACLVSKTESELLYDDLQLDHVYSSKALTNAWNAASVWKQLQIVQLKQLFA